MTMAGRVGAVLAVIAALVGVSMLAAHYLRPSDGNASPWADPAETPKTNRPVETETPVPPPAEASGPEAGELDWFEDHEAPDAPPTERESAEAEPPATPSETGPDVGEKALLPGPPSEPASPAETAAPGDADLPAPARGSTAEGERLAAEGLALVKQNRLVEAQQALSTALRKGVGGEQGRLVRGAVNMLADRIQFARGAALRAPHVASYRVESGDTLTAISHRFLVPYPLIAKINGLSGTSIYAGQQLKVVKGPVNVIVLKSAYELQAWLGDTCVRVYPVGLGAENSTPEGTFVVKQKIRNPPYQPQHKPASAFRASGAPDNPLGTRWIDIGNHYGIHGTLEPDSIGRAVSEGCIRLRNPHVEELFDLVMPKATTVTIRP